MSVGRDVVSLMILMIVGIKTVRHLEHKARIVQKVRDLHVDIQDKLQIIGFKRDFTIELELEQINRESHELR